jgi:hypothetical protein
LWNAATGKELFRLPGHGRQGSARTHIAFTPDSTEFVTTGDDLFVRVWDVRTGKALAEHIVRPPRIELRETDDGGADDSDPRGYLPLVSPSGRLFLLLAIEKIIVFDAQSGRKVRELPRPVGDTAGSHLLTISPDDKYLLASEQGPHIKLPDGRWHATEGFLRLMDLSSGKTVRKMPFAGGWTDRGVFSPNGEFLATATRAPGGPISIRRSATGEEIVLLSGFDAQVTSLAFSADNRLLVTGLFDTTSLVWDIPDALRGKSGEK